MLTNTILYRLLFHASVKSPLVEGGVDLPLEVVSVSSNATTGGA